MLFSRVLRLFVWVFRLEVVKKLFGLFRVEFIFLFVVSLFWMLDMKFVVDLRMLRFW